MTQLARWKLTALFLVASPLFQLATCGLSEREAAGVVQGALTTALAGIIQSVFAAATQGPGV
jgi:hypothetical protein